jgi:hypothetical protein
MVRSNAQLAGILVVFAASACFEDTTSSGGAGDESGDGTGTAGSDDGGTGDDGGGTGTGGGGDDGGTASTGGTGGDSGGDSSGSGVGTGSTGSGTEGTGGETNTTGSTDTTGHTDTTGGATSTGVLTCADPDAPDCGDHGECVDDPGGAYCDCEKGYGGELCTECTEGYVDNNGVCEADCGDCGDHAFCDETPEIPECACVPAYVDPGGGCVWGGGLQDPPFAEGDTYWLPIATAMDPNAFGPGDGSATFNNIGLCGLASVSQAVEMPAYGDAEPLVFEVVSYPNAGFEECDAGAYLRTNTGYVNLQFPGGSPSMAAACLGSAAFGGNVDFALVADALTNGMWGGEGSACFDTGDPCVARTFREASIRVAGQGECPEPGIIVNPDFSDGENGWTWWENNTNGYTMWAEVQGGQAALYIEKTCSGVSMSQTMSFPTAADLPNPALRLTQTGTDGKPLAVNLNGRPWMTILGNGALRTSNLCIPEYAQGMVYDVELRLYIGGGCGQDDVRDFTLDDFAFVSEPSCAASNASIDGGFESSYDGATETPWALSRGSYSNNDSYAEILLDVANARSGNGVLRMYTSGAHQFGDAQARVRVQVPAPSGGLNPALRFWYRSVNPGDGSVTVSPANYQIPYSAQPDVYEEHEVCLNTDWAGQIVPVGFYLDGGTNETGAGYHWIDDVDVVLSSGC